MSRSRSRSRQKHKKRSSRSRQRDHKHKHKHESSKHKKDRHKEDDRRYQHKHKHKHEDNSPRRTKIKQQQNKAQDSRHKLPVRKSVSSSSERRRERKRSQSPNHGQQERGKYYKPKADPNLVKQLPCFTPSGILLQYYNAREGVALKFHQPPEARQPTDNWRIYPFKKDEQPLPPILLKGQSCFLFGKDNRICDILAQNPSISRQHAVIQFREIKSMTKEGSYLEEVKPYIMDLDSSNGTYLNDDRIPSSRYVELFSEDRIRFAQSLREYVLLRDQDIEAQNEQGSEEN